MNKMYKNILLLLCMLGASRNIAGSEMSRFFKYFDGPPCFIGLLTGVVACIVHEVWDDASRCDKRDKSARNLQASREAKMQLDKMAPAEPGGQPVQLEYDKVTYRKDTIDHVIGGQEIELANITAELSEQQTTRRLMRNAIIMPFFGMLGGGSIAALEVSRNENHYITDLGNYKEYPPVTMCMAGALAAILAVKSSLAVAGIIRKNFNALYKLLRK